MRNIWLVLALSGVLIGCGREEAAEAARVPDPAVVEQWFGEDTDVRLSEGVLELRGEIPPRFLERGGTIWRRSGPYFYLFNVQVRDLLVEYPGIQAVRAVAVADDGTELARATLRRGELNEYEWRQVLALASLAQREGTRNPRRIERLIEWGEENTEFWYAE